MKWEAKDEKLDDVISPMNPYPIQSKKHALMELIRILFYVILGIGWGLLVSFFSFSDKEPSILSFIQFLKTFFEHFFESSSLSFTGGVLFIIAFYMSLAYIFVIVIDSNDKSIIYYWKNKQFFFESGLFPYPKRIEKIPFNEIKDIKIISSPFQRMFKLASVIIKSEKSKIIVPNLNVDDANRLKEELRELIKVE